MNSRFGNVPSVFVADSDIADFVATLCLGKGDFWLRIARCR